MHSPDAVPPPDLAWPHLAASVFDNAAEGILITDAQARIVDVNPAFTRITGHAREDVIGRTPALLSSGRHDAEFYRRMWRSLLQDGHWNGEIWNRRRDGRLYAEWLRITGVTDEQGRLTHYVGIFSDMTSQKQHHEALERLAHFDALTGLPNRALMLDRLAQMMAQANRSHEQVAVCVLDLDGFEAVNDRWGHGAGDALLQHAAERMRHVLRGGDTVARLGGDEFVLLVGQVQSPAEAQAAAERVLHTLAEPYTLPGGSATVTCSIGVALYPQHDRTAEHLLRDADQAMYRAKRLGKNRVCFVDTVDEAAQRRLRVQEAVAAALRDGELCVHYQPKVDAATRRLRGVEALVRWQHPERGLLPPGEFLPALEGSRVEVKLDFWVMEQALAQLARWQAAGLDIGMSVNLSAATMAQPGLVDEIAGRVERARVRAAGRFELEVVESAALDDMAGAEQAIHACAARGLLFALDDFGTGYSSLAYLRRLPVQTLKIDQSFVRRMLEDRNDMHIVKAVIGLARAFAVSTVAEGVETQAQARALAALGCDQLQGYGIARPMAAEALDAWLRERQPAAA